jgi:lipoprotein-anchoring transpeptidase ErfK/SrfK
VDLEHTPAGQTGKHAIRIFLALALALCLSAAGLTPKAVRAAPAPDIWLAVDTNALSLAVMRGDTPVKVFENIAIGSNGPTLVKKRGDETTPLGEFTITQIRRSQRFELFMAINYPNLDHTERAFVDQRIDISEYKALRHELDRGQPPPQGTSLGGQLGIHGVGTGNLEIHQAVNWTDGCIALTNEQVQELAGWVAVGTRVIVR